MSKAYANAVDANNQQGGRRNLIINGAMQVAQRGTGPTNNSVSGGGLTYQTIDRWGYWAGDASDFSVAQVTDAPSGFSHSLKVTSLAASTITTGYYATISTRLEGNSVTQLNLGSSDAQNFTFSFWVKASIAGTYSVYAFNNGFSYCYVDEYTVNDADTWERKTITITGPSSGTFLDGTSNALEIGFNLSVGTSWSTSTLGQWLADSFNIGSPNSTDFLGTNGATFQVTGVQLEVGSVATPFEHRSYGEELALCQRYFERFTPDSLSGAVATGQAYSSANVQAYFGYVEKRAAPTYSQSGNIYLRNSTGSSGNASLNTAGTGIKSMYVDYIRSGGGLTAGNASLLRLDTSNAYMDFDAEL